MFAFFLVSTVINKMLMSPVSVLTVELEKCEGDFRFKHMTVRAGGEGLAFQASAAHLEAAKLDSKLDRVCTSQQGVFNRTLVLDLVRTSR